MRKERSDHMRAIEDIFYWILAIIAAPLFWLLKIINEHFPI